MPNDTPLVTPPPAPALPAPPAPPAVTAPPGNVVDLDAARAQGAAQHAAEVRQIAELCQLAGKPALAVDFISTGKSLADVRKALIDEKAKEDAKLGEVSNHQPARQPSTPAAAMAGWDSAFQKVHATTMPRRA